MEKSLKTIVWLLVAGCLCACSGGRTEADYRVVPLPREIRMTGQEAFALGGDVKITYPEGNAAMARNAAFLAEYLEAATGKAFRTQAGAEGRGNILLRLEPGGGLPAEGYRLTVDGGGVVISGGSEAGVFYGIQTLRKSLPVAPGATPVLPAVEIEDAPRFGYRGVHFDICRHFFTVDEAKEFIDMMALHNMNRLHWHLSDDQGWRIEIGKYPLLTEIGSRRTETVIGRNSGKYDGKPYGGYYTRGQAREIVEYAAERHITVIPEIDLPGHMQAALAAYPHLGCTGGPYHVWREWGVSEEVLCAGNDSVLTFIDGVLAEIMDIFPSEYIHIGGDECPKTRWKACPKCQARIKALGFKSDDRHTKEEYLQSFIIRHAGQFLEKHGRKMIGWDEILEGGIAPNATVMSWRGEGGGIEAAKQGHDVIMVPNTYFYFDYYQSDDTEGEPLAIGGYVPLERVYSYNPAPAALAPGEQRRILGVQANHWSEYITSFPHLQYMALPRWAALCEIQWNRADREEYPAFLQRLLRLTALYRAEGYNYATHVFDVAADIRANDRTGAVEVRLSTIDRAPIRYTLDGTLPTASSPLADTLLSLRGDCSLRAVAMRPGGGSRLLSEEIAFSRSTCKPVTANRPVHPQYRFKGASTLVDGLKGGRNYKTGRWVGFYRDAMDITIDLQQPAEISEVSFTACVEKGDWIFDARAITVEVSQDGSRFEKVFAAAYPAMQADDRNGLYPHRLPFPPAKARYVRVVAQPEHSIPAWHGGKGNPGFLFVDEITVR